MEKHISPSILACDILHLEEAIRKVERSGADYVHIDIMDGVFVPNISFGMPIVSAVRKITELTLDVHLMIVEPWKYIETFAKCGADILTLHYEALPEKQIPDILRAIRQNGMKVALSVKPKTEVSVLFPYLELLDMILIMTVEPGFGGQKYIPESADKIATLHREIQRQGLPIHIQVDGGINASTIRDASDAGANVFVLGTAFFTDPSFDANQTIKELNA
ncbi:MAG: ribulose-phosphate 3-epimerase [Clostridia bacterium]|nr:ribulose-phosphate 3-epimerase [Clostridia bacterium]